MLETGYTVVSGTVTSIPNKATGGTFATAATAFPFLSSINGRPAMSNDAQPHGLMSTDTTLCGAFSGTDKPFTVIYVQQAVAFGTCAIFSVGSTTVESRCTALGVSATGAGRHLVYKEDDTGANVLTVGSTDTDLRPHVVSWVCTGTSIALYVDGQQGTLATAAIDLGATTIDRAGLFCLADQVPNLFINARGGCWIAFNRALNDYQRSGVEVALMARWGIP
jgi:hypothetical protein